MDSQTVTARVGRIQRLYLRHFADRPRATRDLALLTEVLGALERLRRVADAEQASTVASIRARFEDERVRIAAARFAGTVVERVGRTAALANTQLQAYRDHFAGQPRLSRRAPRLRRMIDELSRVQAQMSSLSPGPDEADTLRRNLRVVGDALASWRAELVQVEEAQRGASTEERAGALGAAANGVFAVYREHFAGQDRATRDLALLGVLLDRLDDVAWEMEDLDAATGNAVNRQNLAIVRERLGIYDREHDAIGAASGKG